MEPTTDVQNGPKFPEIHVQLSGEDGNAFFIMGRVGAALRRAGIPKETINEFYDDAKSGDYDHLLQTCMRWVTCD